MTGITDEDLFRLPKDGRKYELVDGEIRVSPGGTRHSQVTVQVVVFLGSYAHKRNLGVVLASSTGFRLPGRKPGQKNVRSPDVSFVATGRFPQDKGPVGFAELAPDLAVEVLSPDDRPRDVLEKVGEFLDAGTRLVWVIDPEKRAAAVYRSLTDVRRLGPGDNLDGEDVVPGFSCRLEEILVELRGSLSAQRLPGRRWPMAIAGLVLAGLAGIAMLVFGIQILIRAFKTSVGWGLASLFLPFAVVVFVVKHWEQTRRPFLRGLACVPVYGLGVALMAFGGAMTMSVTPVGAGEAEDTTPPSAPLVETATLVLETVTATQPLADPAALPQCDEAAIGRTAVGPNEVRICARQTDVFEATKTDWLSVPREPTSFGEPVGGQWVSWMRVAKKDSREQAAFVVFNVKTRPEGRWMQLECDAGGMNRTQVNGTMTPGYRDECETVAEKLGFGRILFNWNPARPRVRFQTTEGPVLDVNLISFTRG